MRHIVTKDLLNKCCSFYSLNNLVSYKILWSTSVFNIDNTYIDTYISLLIIPCMIVYVTNNKDLDKKCFLAANQHIKKISKDHGTGVMATAVSAFAITEIKYYFVYSVLKYKNGKYLF